MSTTTERPNADTLTAIKTRRSIKEYLPTEIPKEWIEELIAQEKTRGIPASKIILAGFSQGCAMALETGLCRHAALRAGAAARRAGLRASAGDQPGLGRAEVRRVETSRENPRHDSDL